MIRVITIVALSMVAVALQYRHEMRSNRIRKSWGDSLLDIRRPMIRSSHAWMNLFLMGTLAISFPSDLTKVEAFDFAVRVVSLPLFLFASASIFYSIWRGDSLVTSRFTTKGVIDEQDDFIPWNKISRWSWLHTPSLQLNIFSGQSVHTIHVPKPKQETLEQLLQNKVGESN